MVKSRDRTGTESLLLLATVLAYAGARATVGASHLSPTSSISTPSTCPFTSVNHITQTLPQQCFTSAWTGRAEEVESPGSSVQVYQTEAPARTKTAGGITSILSAVGTPASQVTDHVNQPPSETHGSSMSSSSVHDAPKPMVNDVPQQEPDPDGDSPLDNAHFLSFEEWKKQNLAKAGQSAESLGARRSGNAEPRRRPGGINNALDSLGEDAEIEIDFAGFVSSPAAPSDISNGRQNAPEEGKGLMEEKDVKAPATQLSSSYARSKSAGQTCKERSNYASFDCAATMLKTNPECKSATSVLVENKDSYMLNLCSADNKFFIVELCTEILVDTVVLANFEFFSSIFRTFRVSVSDKYPVKLDKWRELGTFEAKNSRGLQAFAIEEPQIWARYLRIEFLTHYGHEYYCPVSLLRVHGSTMMEEFNRELKISKGEDDAEGEVEEEVPQEAHSIQDVVTAETVEQETKTSVHQSSPVTSPGPDLSTGQPATGDTGSQEMEFKHEEKTGMESSNFTPFQNASSAQLAALFASEPLQSCRPDEVPASAFLSSPVSMAPSAETAVEPSSTPSSTAMSTNSSVPTSTRSRLGDGQTSATASSQPQPLDSTHAKANDSTVPSSRPAQHAYSQLAPKAHSTSTHPSAPNPTTQESFFKSVHKRLQLLESNSTLSLQYIEEQSRILRDAFAKVEKRQLAKTTTFLEILNRTVLGDLRVFREQYEQLWQSTVVELASQRRDREREVEALSGRLKILADELLFQKRIAILQFLLILLCLGLAFFSRGSAAATGVGYLEHVVNKSSINLSRYASMHPDQSPSPPGSSSSTRPPSRYGWLGRGLSSRSEHRRGPSDESMGMGMGDEEGEGAKSPSIEYSPPTPTSLGEEGEGEGEGESANGSPPRGRGGGNEGLLSPEEGNGDSGSSGGTTPEIGMGYGSS
ncbi:MAG: hypothetical protein LQ350_003659 [Teloschistes chrysophthalmus]|nr:MAG: hypothetical protein LQ350_003659 [Niorma chrysophthalma]